MVLALGEAVASKTSGGGVWAVSASDPTPGASRGLSLTVGVGRSEWWRMLAETLGTLSMFKSIPLS
jgi:hypothetical protein